MLAKLSVSHMHGQKVRYSFDRWMKRHNGKIRRTPFQIHVFDIPPATLPQSAVARRLVWQAEWKERREKEWGESKGYIKAAPWTVQTSLDQWPVQWLLLRSGASSVRAKRKTGVPLFSVPEQLTARGCLEVRRAGRAGICFHGYGPGMGTPLLRKLRSHAPSEAMSRILKYGRTGPGLRLGPYPQQQQSGK